VVDLDPKHSECHKDDRDDGDGRQQDAEVEQQGREAIGGRHAGGEGYPEAAPPTCRQRRLAGKAPSVARRGLILALLVLADAWMLLTVFNAITRSGGHGPVFWAAVALLVVILAVLLRLTVSTWRGLRSRPSPPLD
jgi:hypothetical protein